MLSRRLWVAVCGVEPGRVRVDGCDFVDGVLLVWMRPRIRLRWRCPRCERRCPGYDAGDPRRWRGLDVGRVQTYVVAAVPRVRCADHGVLVAGVPWARPGARHTRAFEQVAAWCAVEMSASAASRLLRCSWRTIGTMVARVAADLRAQAGGDGLDGLRRIGIDEISYRRGHQYLLVVVDHDRRRLVWAQPGRDRATVEAFFDDLGARVAQLTHLSSDSAEWIARAVTARAPHVVHCADPFHVVGWAGEALDVIRRRVWNAVRTRRGRNRPATGEGKKLKHALWALRKDPGNWTDKQTESITWIQVTHPQLHRAWQLKEALRAVFTFRDGAVAVLALDAWTEQARHSRLAEFDALADKITKHRATIDTCLNTGLSNALVESTNTKIRLITRRAYGFHNVNALIALATLSLGRHRVQLPT